MGKKKDKEKKISKSKVNNQQTIELYTFDKSTLKQLINDSIGEVVNPDLLNNRTKSLIAWIRANTDIAYVREKQNRKMGF